MTLRQCMRRIGHREFLTWMAWFELEQNRPSRADHYQMQTAAEVRRGHAKQPRKVVLEQFKIPFRRKGENPERPRTVEEATARSKARWGWIPKWSKVPSIPVKSGDDIRLKDPE